MWRPFSDLSDIPAPPLLDDILPSQAITDEFDSFSASQALRNSPSKSHGILKSRSTSTQPRPRVRFVPPVQRNLSSQAGQAQSQLSQEDLFNDTFGSQNIQSSLEKGPAFDDLPYPSQPNKEVQRPVLPLIRHSQDDDFPGSIHIPALSTPGGTQRGAKCLRSIEEIPDQYRSIFPFPYFNFVQSQVLDDILYTDKPLVVSAPTGSGKTVLFELAILRLLISQGGYDNRTKVVYMAPIKVLCSQRCDEWKDKFEPLGLKCQELTGDTDIEDFYQLQAVNIIFTTPEKWDSMTRKWRDNHSLVQLVKLFLIDEVHSLNEETRGATVEAVISRMKTVQAAQPDHHTNSSNLQEESSGPGLRFLAVSATIPNIKDIAEWLGIGDQSAVYHKFDDSHRPVKLRKVVLGYPCTENFSEFKFDLSLNYKLSGVIQTYSENKPSLVFCATRKAVEQAASILVKEARFILNAQCRQRLQMYNNRIRDSKLRDLVMNGVGYHHAGLDLQDRKAIEDMFLQGDLPVLMATSTLAMGVNLPAHLVVVKSSQHYACGTYTEYSETQILQMIGRAGRPQFDTSATAVIMTKHKTKGKYDNLLNGTEEIESSLHKHLIEHLNAEIVLHTINDMDIALEWLKSTFLYIRIQKNPTHYGLPKGLTQMELEKKLQEMCTKDLTSLASINLIQMDQGSKELKPLETGRLMARYCVAFETMKQFTKLNGSETVSDLMVLLSQCKEFSDVQLRINERKVLNKMNKDKNHVTIRYPMTGKIKTNDMKVNCLIQATLGSIPIQEFALNQDCYKIFRAGQRLTRCLTEYLMTRPEFKALLNALVTSKCIQAKLWENSKYVARQLDKIGPTMSNALVHAGLDSFQKLENKNPRELELIVNRHPPFGNQIVEAVSHLPKYDVSIEQISKYSPVKAEINITVCLQNHERVAEKQTTKPNHMVILLLGDADNKVVYKQRIADNQLVQSGIWMRKVEVKRALNGEDLSVNLISQDFVGLDVQSVYTPFYSGPKHLRAAASEAQPPQLAEKKLPLRRLLPGLPGHPTNKNKDGMDPYQRRFSDRNSLSPSDDGIQDFEGYGSRKPCSHRCLDKNTCAHDCCKFGVPIRPPPRPRAPATKRLQALDEESATAGGGNSYDPRCVATTPSRPKGPRGIDGFLDLMRQRSRDISVTPNIKRLKFSDSTPTALPKLDQFAYTPKRSLLPAMDKAAVTPATSNPPTITTTRPKPSTKEPQRATGWEHLDFYRHQREMEILDMQSEQCHGPVEDLYGDNDDDELPKVSLGFDESSSDLPCFDIGGSDIYGVDAMDDIICVDDLDSHFHPTLNDTMKGKSYHNGPSEPSSQTPGYLWSGMPARQQRPIQEQSVPTVGVPAGRKLYRKEPAETVAASTATLSMPAMELRCTGGADDQYVTLGRKGYHVHKSDKLACGDSLGGYRPLGGGFQSLPLPLRGGVESLPRPYGGGVQSLPRPLGCGVQSLPRPHSDGVQSLPRPHSDGVQSLPRPLGGGVQSLQRPLCGGVQSLPRPLGGVVQSLPRPKLSDAWNKPLAPPVHTGRTGTRQPDRSPYKLLYGKAARNLDSFSATPSKKPSATPLASNASPDERSLMTCLDAAEQDYLQKKQGSDPKTAQTRAPLGSFFVNKSPEADDDIPEFDSIFKDLF